MDIINSEKRVSRIIITLNIIFIICIVGIIFYYNYILRKSYDDFSSENKKLLERYLKREQMSMKAELDDVIEFIKYQREVAYENVKRLIKQKTDEAINISETLLSKEALRVQKFESKDKVLSILKSISSENGNEGYFVYEVVSENEVIARYRALSPDKEGLNCINEIDGDGKKFVRSMLNKINEEDSGYVEYTFENTDSDDIKKEERIAFVAYFKEFNWIIGYEKNRDSIDKEVREYAIRVLKMRNRNSDKKRISVFKIDESEQLKLLISSLGAEEMDYVRKEYKRRLNKELQRGIVFKKYKSKVDTESIAYFTEIPEWKWLVSAGVNIDNIKKEVNDKKREIEEQFNEKLKHSIFFGIAVILIVSILSYVLVMLVKKIISIHKDEIADKNRQIDTRDREIETSEMRLERVDEVYKKQIEENENLLKDAIRKKELIFSNPKIAFLFLDKHLKITDANIGFYKLFKYEEEDLRDKDIKIFYKNKADLTTLINEIENKLEKGSVLDLEQNLIDKNGNSITCHITGSYIEENGVEQIVLAILDISFTKKVQNKIENIKNEEKVKSEFISNISHEIKTPLNAIKGFAELLESDNLTPVQKKYLESIKMSGDNLLLVINDIIDISMLEDKNIKLNSTLIDLELFFKKIRDIFVYKIKQKNLQFSIEISNNVPRFINIDQKRLRQMIINLVNNAITHTEKGFVKIEVNSKIDKLFISVIDSGRGITVTNLQRLNEAFEEESNFSEELGIGLSIVKKLSNLLGCKIHFESKINKGTKATIICPIDLKNLKKGEVIGEKEITLNKEEEDKKKKEISYENLEIIWKLEEIKNSDLYKNNFEIVNFKECKFILKQIYKIGKEYKSKEILKYSRELHEAIESYDLEAIQKKLGELPKLIESL